MPVAFEKCVAGGGRVRTKTLSGRKFMHVCFKGDQSFAGHVKTKKSSSHGSKRKGALHSVR